MTLASTVPEFWSNLISALLSEKMTAVGLVNTSYEGQIRSAGDTVNIQIAPEVNISDYTGSDITVQGLDPAVAQLVITTDKYFAFSVDSTRTEVQSSMDLMGSGVARAANRLADAADTAVYAQYAAAGTTYAEAGAGWTIGSDGAGVAAFLSGLVRTAEVANIPLDGFTFVAPPAFREGLSLHFGGKGNSLGSRVGESGATSNGANAGSYLGVDVVISNNLTTAGSNVYGLAFARGLESGIAYASQVDSVEVVPHTLKRANAKIAKGSLLFGTNVYQAGRVVAVPLSTSLLS